MCLLFVSFSLWIDADFQGKISTSWFREGISLEIIPAPSLSASGNKSYSTESFLYFTCFGFALTQRGDALNLIDLERQNSIVDVRIMYICKTLGFFFSASIGRTIYFLSFKLCAILHLVILICYTKLASLA